MQDKISKLKHLLQKTGLEGEPGSIIYSADSTLKKANFIFWELILGEIDLNIPIQS